MRVESLPAAGAEMIIVTVEGMRKMPDAVTDEPKPYPLPVGVWTNCGISTKALNIPSPTTKPTRFVVQTARNRIIFMSTSGVDERSSTRIHRTARTTATENSPIVRDEVQPQ